jgi:hypothetical protein
MSHSKQVAFPRWGVAVTALVAVVLGCGGSGGSSDGPIDPPERVFASLLVTPGSATICTIAPGNAVTVTATALDQSGQPMTRLGNPSFSNSNPSAATVDANGHSHTVTLTAPQMMQIAAGCRTSQESSRNPHSDGNGDHSHTVVFN